MEPRFHNKIRWSLKLWAFTIGLNCVSNHIHKRSAIHPSISIFYVTVVFFFSNMYSYANELKPQCYSRNNLFSPISMVCKRALIQNLFLINYHTPTFTSGCIVQVYISNEPKKQMPAIVLTSTYSC